MLLYMYHVIHQNRIDNYSESVTSYCLMKLEKYISDSDMTLLYLSLRYRQSF